MNLYSLNTAVLVLAFTKRCMATKLVHNGTKFIHTIKWQLLMARLLPRTCYMVSSKLIAIPWVAGNSSVEWSLHQSIELDCE